MKKLCDLKEVVKEIYKFESELHKNFKLSINESLCLCTLSSGEMSSGDLAKEIGISVSRMSRILKSLEDKKLVMRNFSDTDKRKMIFTITDSGMSKILKLKKSELMIPEIKIYKGGE